MGRIQYIHTYCIRYYILILAVFVKHWQPSLSAQTFGSETITLFLLYCPLAMAQMVGWSVRSPVVRWWILTWVDPTANLVHWLLFGSEKSAVIVTCFHLPSGNFREPFEGRWNTMANHHFWSVNDQLFWFLYLEESIVWSSAHGVWLESVKLAD